MTHPRPSILKLMSALLLAAPVLAQTPVPLAAPQQAQTVLPKTQPSFYRNLIVLDPAHGGTDHGAQLPDGVMEKDVTLAFAQKLRPALVAQGFTVVGTRDSDPSDQLASDQRAGTANHVRPLACLLLHATDSGKGVHLATSPLESDVSKGVVRWNEAQAGSVAMSIKLANEVGIALSGGKLPVVLLRASVPPIDNLTCAAVVVEIAPLMDGDNRRTPVTDAAYQQRLAQAIAQGLASYRTRNAPAPAAAPAVAPEPQRPSAPAPAAPKAAAPAKLSRPAQRKPALTAKSASAAKKGASGR